MQQPLTPEVAAVEQRGVHSVIDGQPKPCEAIELVRRLHNRAGRAEQRRSFDRPSTGPAGDDITCWRCLLLSSLRRFHAVRNIHSRSLSRMVP
jgi:hypothetical protein